MQCIPNVFPSLLHNKNVARWCKMWQASKDSWKFKLGINSHFNGQSNMGSMDLASLNHKIQQPLSRGFNQLRKSDDHRILHMFFDGLLVSNKPSLRTACSQSIIGSPFHLSGNSFLQQIHVLVDPRTLTGMVSVWFHLHPCAINFKGYQSAPGDYLGPSAGRPPGDCPLGCIKGRYRTWNRQWASCKSAPPPSHRGWWPHPLKDPSQDRPDKGVMNSHGCFLK